MFDQGVNRRTILAGSAAIGTVSLYPAAAAAAGSVVRPFHYRATDAELSDLRRRYGHHFRTLR